MERIKEQQKIKGYLNLPEDTDCLSYDGMGKILERLRDKRYTYELAYHEANPKEKRHQFTIKDSGYYIVTYANAATPPLAVFNALLSLIEKEEKV